MTCMTALIAGCQTAPDMDVEQEVEALYQKMPQEERIAQLKSMYMEELFDEKGQLDTMKCREMIPYGIGHFSQYAFQKPRDPNEAIHPTVFQRCSMRRCCRVSIRRVLPFTPSR